MSDTEMVTIYQPGDHVHTMGADGRARVYIVKDSGELLHANPILGFCLANQWCRFNDGHDGGCRP